VSLGLSSASACSCRLFLSVSFGLCASLWSLLGVLRGFYCLSSLVFGLFLLLPLFFVPCSVVLLVFVLGVWVAAE